MVSQTTKGRALVHLGSPGPDQRPMRGAKTIPTRAAKLAAAARITPARDECPGVLAAAWELLQRLAGSRANSSKGKGCWHIGNINYSQV